MHFESFRSIGTVFCPKDAVPMERKTVLWQSATKILFLRNIIRNLS
ncbi:MAG: hypothetical protein K9J37_17985 [Saprospiraceae bacterium]|nr:hypothetical protein [Saprospiraceae bacterium]MCF8251809.1 hypothetical protein [Saprospiraceae bacterium]MCF8281463.1 hypothetical protein [Bacteroidales bacterium]MCF8313523.1 hypothetical protein [Saprospiraceae bacterium]MCF8442254.1 hypothetical protein [Saprospiraceae bacterium]